MYYTFYVIQILFLWISPAFTSLFFSYYLPLPHPSLPFSFTTLFLPLLSLFLSPLPAPPSLLPSSPYLISIQTLILRFILQPPSSSFLRCNTHHNEGVGAGHHSDQEVEKDDNVDHRVRAEHEHGPEPRVLADASQFEVVQAHHAETSPEE